MKKKRWKSCGIILLSVLFCWSIFFTFSALSENNQIRDEINEFIKDAEKEGVFSKKYNTTFYKVKKHYIDKTPSFTYVEQNKRPPYLSILPYVAGSSGDILTSLHSPIENAFLRNFIEFYFGGHAAIVNGIDLVETTGLNEDMSTNVVIESFNDWLRPENGKRSEFIGLKVKSAPPEDRKSAYEVAHSFLGQPYNYTFILNTKKSHYCTDLVSKSYQNVNKKYDLNEDEIAVTVQDLITSSHTYIFMYKSANENGSYNVYYLDDGNDYNFDLA